MIRSLQNACKHFRAEKVKILTFFQLLKLKIQFPSIAPVMMVNHIWVFFAFLDHIMCVWDLKVACQVVQALVTGGHVVVQLVSLADSLVGFHPSD